MILRIQSPTPLSTSKKRDGLGNDSRASTGSLKGSIRSRVEGLRKTNRLTGICEEKEDPK